MLTDIQLSLNSWELNIGRKMIIKLSRVSLSFHSARCVGVRFQSTYKNEVVETEYGPIKGVKKPSVLGRMFYNFQGIPYMKAPLGKLRFRDAQAPDKWTEPLDVTSEPPGYCMRTFLNYKDGGREDAAVVNVYTPYTNPKTPMPVLVFIHGGGWNSGSGQTDLFGPDYFMQKDVVLVTMNYRLGPAGFLSLDDPEVNVPGNAGLKDQTFALKWVQKNIKNFGGDPGNVTLFGESAGGASTHFHMISDLSRGLFHKAIPMSGNSFCSAFSKIPRGDWALRLAKNLGYTGKANDKEILNFLEKPDGMSIVQAAKKVLTFEEEIGLHILYAFGPVVEPYRSDNCLVPEDPIKMSRKAWSTNVDMLIGATSNEGILRVNSDAQEIADILQNVNFFAPAVQLGIDTKSDKAREYGQRIMDVYYNGSKPSASNQQPYLYFIADLYFWHGIQRVLSSRLKRPGKGSNYLYRFDVSLSQNFVKKMHLNEDEYHKYPGASHCDELPYLFKTAESQTNIVSPTLGSKEFEMITTMVDTFSAFAATGDPNNPKLNQPWPQITSNDSLPCMNFNEVENKISELPEAERLRVWNEIFACEKVDLD